MLIRQDGSKDYPGRVLRLSDDAGEPVAVCWDGACEAIEECDPIRTEPDAPLLLRLEIAKIRASASFQAWKDQALKRAQEIQVGREVRVIAGRKLPHGTIGVVFWMGEVPEFHRGEELESRVGIWVDDKKYFVHEQQLEVADPGQYLDGFSYGERAIMREALEAAFSGDPALDDQRTRAIFLTTLLKMLEFENTEHEEAA